MDHPRNSFKAAIRAGKQQIGLWCSINEPTVAEMLAGCGYDWMMFDTEHAPMNTLSVLTLLQAVAPYPVSAVVRPGSLDPAEIKKLLDSGAQTILVPYVQTTDEARLAAASVAYPPEGMRGVAGITRATRYGTVRDYQKNARDEICLIIQIETKAALDNLDDMLAVPGIDAFFVGPADLAASLGYAGDPTHPEVRRVCAETIRRITEAGFPAGFLSLDQSFLDEMVEAGSIFTAVDVDAAILRRGAAAQSEAWRARMGA